MRFSRAHPFVEPRSTALARTALARTALARTALTSTVLVVAMSVGVVACGTTDDASRETLPPLETTTTTTTTTTTIPQERFYEIQPGDSLSIIAELRGVTVVDILNLNPQLDNENDIQAGVVIQIPETP